MLISLLMLLFWVMFARIKSSDLFCVSCECDKQKYLRIEIGSTIVLIWKLLYFLCESTFEGPQQLICFSFGSGSCQQNNALSCLLKPMINYSLVFPKSISCQIVEFLFRRSSVVVCKVGLEKVTQNKFPPDIGFVGRWTRHGSRYRVIG